MKKQKILALIILSCFSCGTSNEISNYSSYEMSQENISSELDSQISSESQGKEISLVHISKDEVSSEKEHGSEAVNNNSQNSYFSEESIKNETFSSISEIKNRAKGFEKLVNNVGVFESDVYVEIKLKLIACLDAVTSKTGYGDRYKLLMSDGRDYIYIKTSFENYDYLKGYVTDQSVYYVGGYISIYNNEIELTVNEKPTYLANETINLDYDCFESKTLEEIYVEINNLKLNCKGIAFSKIIKTEVLCLAKDINNTNLYFGSGNKIINVHGNDKVTNKFTKGKSYVLIGALSMHNFRPGLEYVDAYSIEEEVEFNINNLETKKASEFYKYTYETDKDATYPNYSKLFENPYIIEGYANSYVKDGKEYIVLEDTYKNSYYSTYQNARDAKSVFFVNEDYTKLTASNSKYCPMYEHLELGTKLEVVVFPYLWNTQKYPQVYCYNFNAI